jgi:hypothetical protein
MCLAQFGVALLADLRVDSLDELMLGVTRVPHVDEVVVPAVAADPVPGDSRWQRKPIQRGTFDAGIKQV